MFFYTRWVRVPRLRSGASARVARERGGCAMNSFEVHGLVDVGRLTRIRSTGRNPGRCPGTFCPRRACTSRRRLVVVAGRGQHVVAHAALRKKTRSGAVGRRTRGKRRGGCSRRSRSACRCPPRPAEKRGRARWPSRTTLGQRCCELVCEANQQIEKGVCVEDGPL